MSRRTLNGMVENAKRFAALQRLETEIVELACEITGEFDRLASEDFERTSDMQDLEGKIAHGRMRIRDLCRRRAAMLRGEG